ncbi:hypothetical protein VP01_6016g2 [Puccinia sorghi]|uniref:Retrovirus-related Pol polyprotein from transposon TNT 1-94-like beta-barrel domain-containing protein n=1 Tax=Puccinia sorghi TaxID=27349 RepID=A0A0L6UI71_9BASI|nr:hypothetical protein VP01_6016g2 [Puccinia sorghi]
MSKLSEEPVENVSALIHELSKKGEKGARKKKRVYCEPGKHNPASKTHDEDHCYQVHPHLRPACFGSQPQPVNPTTQLVEVDNGHESEVSLLLVESKQKPIVLDTGATHHMVNDPSCFIPVAETNVKISTGVHINLLYATAVGKATLINQEGNTVELDNMLLVPSLSRSLISIPRLFNKSFVIEKSQGDGVKLSPVRINWNNRLGHPNAVYQRALVSKSEIEDCSICKECKLKALPLNSSFKEDLGILARTHRRTSRWEKISNITSDSDQRPK